MNHRVKNSLSIATSLISLQESKGSDSDCTRALEAVRSRINSIALVHERLSSPDSSGNLRVDLYLEALIANIADNSPRFTLQQHLCGVELDASRALTLGLVVNELIANAVKYASDANGEGYAEVSMDEQDDRITLCIKDKGPGFPQRAENGIGTELVDTLIKQLRGTVARRTEGGAIIELSFPAGKDT
jgi:two-component sensor histidine kinase